jgi:hypothetical protein
MEDCSVNPMLKWISFFIFSICCASQFLVGLAFAESPVQQKQEKPWDQRSWEDKVYHSRYEDRYTFKHGKPFILDPWTWGYTKEFAERFRMPEQWIEPELKGALAVAWRMTTVGDTTCGLGQKEDNCWKPLSCQLDVYYDNKIALPWHRPEVVRDNRMPGLTSSRFLEIPPKTWPPEERGGPRGGGGDFEYGKYNMGPSNLVNFDGELQPGVGLISTVGNGVCPPNYAGPEKVVINFRNPIEIDKYSRGEISKKDIRIVHTIEFPKSFLRRAKALYDVQSKPNNDVMDNLIKQFFDHRKKQGQPADVAIPNR